MSVTGWMLVALVGVLLVALSHIVNLRRENKLYREMVDFERGVTERHRAVAVAASGRVEDALRGWMEEVEDLRRHHGLFPQERVEA